MPPKKYCAVFYMPNAKTIYYSRRAHSRRRAEGTRLSMGTESINKTVGKGGCREGEWCVCVRVCQATLELTALLLFCLVFDVLSFFLSCCPHAHGTRTQSFELCVCVCFFCFLPVHFLILSYYYYHVMVVRAFSTAISLLS